MIDYTLLFLAQGIGRTNRLNRRWIDVHTAQRPNFGSQMNNHRTIGQIKRESINIHRSAGTFAGESRAIENAGRRRTQYVDQNGLIERKFTPIVEWIDRFHEIALVD